MKTLHCFIISLVVIFFGINFSNVYAPCVEGPGINCNNYPPPALTQINTDKLNYETSEKPAITIIGVPYAVAHLEIDDPSSNILFTHDINLSSNGTARYVLDISSYKLGVYSTIATSLISKLTTSFTVGLAPTGGSIMLNTDRNSYRPGDNVTIVGAWNPNTLIQLSLIDTSGISVKSMQVFSDKTGHFSSLDFSIPRMATYGTWKIDGTSGVNHVSVNINVENIPGAPMDKTIVLSPLKQFNSGVTVDNIFCKEGLYLAIKSHDNEPTCLKAGTISKLASRGFLYGINANEINYTTILIPPGSENPSSKNTYSPDVATVVIGVNNTVRWVSQAEVANTIAPDMPLQQDGKSFGSDGVIKPGGSYQFTFTEPGTFSYHTEPHPWMKGKIIVLSPLNTDSHTSREENSTLPASFMPCDSPYPQSSNGIAVLYMPANSIGKICVRYSNPNDSPEPIGITIFDADNIHHQNVTGITTWSDSTTNTIPKGDVTIVYWIKTGNLTGLYGLTFFCGDWKPLAVGYDRNSNMTRNNFPFLNDTFPCPLQSYQYHIDSLTGIDVKQIP